MSVPVRYIYTAAQLNAIKDNEPDNYNYYYILMANISLSGYANWTPIGNASNNFTGTFDGNNHNISNITIDRPDNISGFDQGLFGQLSNSGMIKKLSISYIDIKGYEYV